MTGGARAGLTTAEVQQQQPGEEGEAHSSSPSGRDCSGTSSLPIAQIGRLKASGCLGLLVGDQLGHGPLLTEGPAMADRDIARGGGLLDHPPAAVRRKPITASRGSARAPQLLHVASV